MIWSTRLLLLMIIGLALGLILWQEDDWFKEHCSKKLNQALSESLQCTLNSKINHINLLTGTIELVDVHAQDFDKNWSWTFDRASISFSWLSLITHGHLNIQLASYHSILVSSVDNFKPAIAEHLRIIIEKPSEKPFIIKNIELKNCKIKLTDTNQSTITGLLQCHIDSLPKPTATIILQQLNLKTPTRTIIEKGSLFIQSGTSFSTRGTLSCPLIAAPHHVLSFTVTTDADSTIVAKISNENNSLHAHCTIDAEQNVSLAGFCAGNLVHPVLPTFSFSGNGDAKTMSGSGSLTFGENNQELAHGSWIFDNKQCSCSIKPTQDVSTRFCHILASECSLQLNINSGEQLFSAQAAATLCQTTGNKKYPFSCTVQASATDHVQLKSSLADFSLNAEFQSEPHWHLKKAIVTKNNQPRAIFAGTHENFNATVDYDVLNDILHELDYSIPGQGKINIAGGYKNNAIDAQLNSTDLHVRCPSVYNAIEEVSAKLVIDSATRTGTFFDVDMRLQKGSVHSSQALVKFNENGSLDYAHMPLLFSRCFLNLKKEFFALISGSSFVEYDAQNGTKIEGKIIIDRAQINTNVLSSEFQRALTQSTASLPLTRDQHKNNVRLQLATRKPVTVKTPVLETSAQLRLSLEGSSHDPEISGSIELLKGSLLFPYQPLFITKGTIEFMPHQPSDPLISLNARNTVKKYTVSLDINGSATNPIIHLESSPHLEKEQILMLLLGGSEDGSLYLMMPPGLSDSLESFIFGSSTVGSKMQKSVKSLLKPLKHVRFVPSFSDQTGRGGLRGAVTIDVNDRLHALLQQNFSLTEDIKIEVDYDISDDTSIRAMKDERGNIGAEVEMRWKL